MTERLSVQSAADIISYSQLHAVRRHPPLRHSAKKVQFSKTMTVAFVSPRADETNSPHSFQRHQYIAVQSPASISRMYPTSVLVPTSQYDREPCPKTPARLTSALKHDVEPVCLSMGPSNNCVAPSIHFKTGRVLPRRDAASTRARLLTATTAHAQRLQRVVSGTAPPNATVINTTIANKVRLSAVVIAAIDSSGHTFQAVGKNISEVYALFVFVVSFGGLIYICLRIRIVYFTDR